MLWEGSFPAFSSTQTVWFLCFICWRSLWDFVWKVVPLLPPKKCCKHTHAHNSLYMDVCMVNMNLWWGCPPPVPPGPLSAHLHPALGSRGLIFRDKSWATLCCSLASQRFRQQEAIQEPSEQERWKLDVYFSFCLPEKSWGLAVSPSGQLHRTILSKFKPFMSGPCTAFSNPLNLPNSVKSVALNSPWVT